MKLFLLLTLFLLSSVVAGQPGFNLVKDLGLPTNHFRDMIIDNDTIVGYGLAYDTSSLLQGLLLAKFDSSGNFITSKLILDPSGDFLGIGQNWGKIIKTWDGGYAMTAAPLISNSAYLIKVTHDLEVEFIKEYPDTVNLSNYNYRLLEIQDGFLLYGSIQRPNYRDDSFIRRVDTQGNTLWFKYFGDYNVGDAIMDIKPLNDSTFITGSVDDVTTNVFGSARTTFRIINWHGNVLQTWKSQPDPEIGYLRKIIPLPGGDFVTYGQYVVEYITTIKVVQPTLARLNANYQVQWIKHFGLKTSLSASATFWDIEPTLDGNYILAGESGIKIPGKPGLPSGWLVKFSLYGDSIWSRHDIAPFPPHFANSHSFGGVGVLSSGSIVAGGAASEGNKNHIWLVKVTTDGCLDTLFCGLVGAEEVWPGKEGAEVKVYPNPASDFLTIEYHLNGNEEPELSLFSVTGQVKGRHRLHRSETSLRVGLENYAPGLYFFKVEQQGRLIHIGKVIVVKKG